MARLSPREVEVLHLVAQQLTNAEIGGRLHISVRTVESHVAALIRKLELDNRRALVAFAVEEATRAQMPPEVETRFVRSNGAYIAYQVMGTDPPDALLVLDGVVPLETTLEEPSLRSFVERLASVSRLIRMDRRGLGLSDPVSVAAPPTIQQWAADAVAVLDAVGARRPIMLGLAEGCTVTAFLAALHPERVGGLVLVHPVPGLESPFPGDPGLIQRHRQMVEARYEESWRQGDVPGDLMTFAPSRANDPSYRRWLLRSFRKASRPQSAPALFDVLHRADVAAMIDRIRVPTLVIHRSGNRYVEPSYSKWVVSRIPGARYVELAGEDHVPYVGDVEPVLTAIERFLKGAQSAR